MCTHKLEIRKGHTEIISGEDKGTSEETTWRSRAWGTCCSGEFMAFCCVQGEHLTCHLKMGEKQEKHLFVLISEERDPGGKVIMSLPHI